MAQHAASPPSRTLDRAPRVEREAARAGAPPSGAPPAVAHGARRKLLPRILPPVVTGALFLALWTALARAAVVPAFVLPTPGSVWESFTHALANGLLLRYGQTTLTESLVGFALGAAVALPLGYAIARVPWLARALEPYLAASQAMPAIALAPLLVTWLGYGLPSVVALCALIVFFPAAINTALGLRTLDREVLDAARVAGAGRWAMLRHIEFPLALPTILAGLRTSLTLSVTGAVVGEFVLGDQGLGGLLNIARGQFDTPLEFATLLALGLLAAALYAAARLLEAVLAPSEA